MGDGYSHLFILPILKSGLPDEPMKARMGFTGREPLPLFVISEETEHKPSVVSSLY